MLKLLLNELVDIVISNPFELNQLITKYSVGNKVNFFIFSNLENSFCNSSKRFSNISLIEVACATISIWAACAPIESLKNGSVGCVFWR